MVLFASLNLSKSIFVPITVVAYLYLGLTYGGYPTWCVRWSQTAARHQDAAAQGNAPKQYSAATKSPLAVVIVR